ncbi:MAG: allantoinase PuuE [Betaproteobacteria bacterium]|nr:allantoinase PuuE [Betaproteobacteria bacterium]
MTSDYPRDVVGYGGTPPHPRWPNGARLAVNFVLNYEEGSEPSIVDGDGRSEPGVEGAVAQFAPGERDLAAESTFEYGSRAGFWRITGLFDERKIPLTVFACALALERNPPAARAIAERGYDICCHGWRWVQMFRLSENEEREHIRLAIASLQKTIGRRPLGWYCRYGPSVNTRRLLVEEGGFLYDSDAYNDDLPYWTLVAGKPHLVVPYSLSNNDGKFTRGNFATGEHFFEYMKDAIDVLYAEGATAPKMLSVGLHMRIIGQPARAAGLLRLLDHVMRHDDIWLCSRIDIARHWRATHPFAAGATT